MTTATAEKFSRWKSMNLSESQQAYASTTIQYATVPAGRRTGKTEITTRKIIARGLSSPEPRRYFLGGPTYKHAKRLFWGKLQQRLRDLKLGWLDKSETDLMIRLYTGTEIWVVGLNQPDRFDGIEWDGGAVDEIGDMKEEVFTEHIRPALMDAPLRGAVPFCYFTGVPAGRNHYWKWNQELALNPEIEHWANYTWTTEEVLPLYLGEEAAQIELDQIRSDIDARTYRQEILGEFVSMGGMAYYNFDQEEHCAFPQEYDPEDTLDLCFDFNIEPGVCAGVQERKNKTIIPKNSEIYIENNSNTVRICNRVIEKWGKHTGMVRCYGDATARAGGTAKVKGNDWDIIKAMLTPVFKGRLRFKVPKENPPVVARINSLNSRLKNVKGNVNYYIDPSNKNIIRCFEGTEADEDGGIKKGDDWKYLTHFTDALGYREIMEHPFAERYRLQVFSF